jgi:hypothetical protein
MHLWQLRAALLGVDDDLSPSVRHSRRVGLLRIRLVQGRVAVVDTAGNLEEKSMLAITYTSEDLRLLEAAEIAESSDEYNQWDYGFRCGTPACMLGGYARKYPCSAASAYIKAALTSRDYSRAREVAQEEFGIDGHQFNDLFGTSGCDDARRDGKKAAAYVRRFVRERAEARIRG